jgi:hypothetical protein
MIIYVIFCQIEQKTHRNIQEEFSRNEKYQIK